MLVFQPVINGAWIDAGVTWTILFIGTYFAMSELAIQLKQGS